MENPVELILTGASDGWEVQALVEPTDRLLAVLKYDLGALPASQRIMKAQEMPLRAWRNWQTFADRATLLADWLRKTAAVYGCRKISLEAVPEHLPYFLAAGFRVEAAVEGCYRGLEARCWLACFLAESDDSKSLPQAADWEEMAVLASVGCGVIRFREEWLMAEIRRDRYSGNSRLRTELPRVEAELAKLNVRTLIVMVSAGAARDAADLQQAGYRYRGELAAHAEGEDGPQDLALWARSAAE